MSAHGAPQDLSIGMSIESFFEICQHEDVLLLEMLSQIIDLFHEDGHKSNHHGWLGCHKASPD